MVHSIPATTRLLAVSLPSVVEQVSINSGPHIISPMNEQRILITRCSVLEINVVSHGAIERRLCLFKR